MSHIHGARCHHHHRRKESILSKKDSVMVVARFRPTNERERKGQHTEELFEFPSDSSLKIKTDEPFLLKHSTPQTQFTYDRVFGPDANQEDVYKVACSKMLEDLFHGINCTVLAYGQTGSGKTHTMMGSKEKRGVIPRLVSSVFEHIEEHYGHSEAAEQKEHHVEVSVSYVEIYMDHVKDLLKPRNTNLRIRENHGHGIWVEGVCEARVISQDDVMHVMDLGSRNRATGRTNMNAHSSRSHSVFFLKLQQLHKDNTTARSSKLILVDLAGSERVENSGATGQTLKEAQQINKSLSALGNVIHSLTTKGSHHIPYRDSKLTWILSDSLGGNSRTTVIVTASPSAMNLEETICSLRFATRAKMIKNKPQINESKSLGEYQRLLRKANKKIRELEEKRDDIIKATAHKEAEEEVQRVSTTLRETQSKLRNERAERVAELIEVATEMLPVSIGGEETEVLDRRRNDNENEEMKEDKEGGWRRKLEALRKELADLKKTGEAEGQKGREESSEENELAMIRLRSKARTKLIELAAFIKKAQTMLPKKNGKNLEQEGERTSIEVRSSRQRLEDTQAECEQPKAAEVEASHRDKCATMEASLEEYEVKYRQLQAKLVETSEKCSELKRQLALAKRGPNEDENLKNEVAELKNELKTIREASRRKLDAAKQQINDTKKANSTLMEQRDRTIAAKDRRIQALTYEIQVGRGEWIAMQKESLQDKERVVKLKDEVIQLYRKMISRAKAQLHDSDADEQ